MTHPKTLFSTLLAGLFLLSLSSCDDDRVIPESQLPAAATVFISEFYADQSIIQIVRDFDESRLSHEYYVTLQNLTRLEFNRKGEITEIDGRTAIPSGAVNTALIEKGVSLFPEAFAIGWELESDGQDLHLSNKVTLEFNRQGEFLRIDD